MLDIHDTDAAGARVLQLTGRLDTNTSTVFDKHCAERVGLDDRVAVDLAGVDYVSSAGLRVFLMLAKKLQKGGGRLVLCGLAPAVREVFDIAGFSRILTLVADRDAALAQLR